MRTRAWMVLLVIKNTCSSRYLFVSRFLEDRVDGILVKLSVSFSPTSGSTTKTIYVCKDNSFPRRSIFTQTLVQRRTFNGNNHVIIYGFNFQCYLSNNVYYVNLHFLTALSHQFERSHTCSSLPDNTCMKLLKVEVREHGLKIPSIFQKLHLRTILFATSRSNIVHIVETLSFAYVCNYSLGDCMCPMYEIINFNITMLHFVLFHNITCTLVVIGMILRSL